MSETEWLRQLRRDPSESVDSFARRTGIRAAWVAAIDEGRFHDLPGGIYGRAALRRYCAALGVDAEPVLAACAPLLREVEDPIAALARMRGLRVPREPQRSPASEVAIETKNDSGWRTLVAASVDAFLILAMLLAVITCTVAAGIPVSALGGGAAAALILVALVLGSSYFLILGGLAGTTLGQQLAGVQSEPAETGSIDFHAIAARTLRCAFGDAVFIGHLGASIGRWIADHNKDGGFAIFLRG